MATDIEIVKEVPKLPPRDPEGHKGDYGRVLVVGGSRGMVGAVALASNAAFRGGAGLVAFAAPETVQLAIAPMCMCATSVPLPCEPDGVLSAGAVCTMHGALEKTDVLAVGPGMDKGGRRVDLVRAAIEQDKPLVLDADGLNNLCTIDGWAALRRCPTVLTPHPGEFGRLTGKGVKDIQSDRQGSAVAASRQWNDSAPDDAPPLVLLLKGNGTVVTDGRRAYVNDTGNPGMAAGGAGDVLTGLIAALIGQGLDAFDAACLGAWAHGRAGDIAARRLGQVSLMASDLLDALPSAMSEAVA